MKQYDMILGESGGKEDDLSRTINKALDEAYNAGIDHAGGLLEKQYAHLLAGFAKGNPEAWEPMSIVLYELIKQVKALKKPTV